MSNRVKRRLAPLYFKGGGGQAQETQYEKAFAEVAQKKWQLYNDEYKPAMDKLISGVGELDTAGAKTFVAGAATTATNQQFDQAADSAATGLQSRGINPNSGAYKTAMSGLRDSQGTATGENATRATNELKNQHVAGLQTVSAIGRGESATAQAGLSDIAELSAQKARNDSLAEFQDDQNLKTAAGMGLGLAAASYEKPANPYALADYTKSMSRGAL